MRLRCLKHLYTGISCNLKHEPIKKVYVEMVRQIVESEAKNDEDVE